MNLTLHEVAHLVHAKNDISQFEDVALVKPEFDSRLIGPGDLFVPLKGARDGHDFIETAFENGAVATFFRESGRRPPLYFGGRCAERFSNTCCSLSSKDKSRCFCSDGVKW